MAKQKFSSGNSDVTAGLIILIIGGVLLLKAVGFWFPFWVISWPMILIAVGLVILARHNFQNGFGFLLVIVGAFFLVKINFGIPFEIRPFLIPAGLIIFGLYLILKRNRDNKIFDEDYFKNMNNPNPKTGPSSDSSYNQFTGTKNYTYTDTSDFVNAQSLFTGMQRRVVSKNFKGGKASAIFGGTEIDLTQADIQEVAMLNIEVAFGGIKLIVPPHWDLQVNMGTMFAAGVEDKRMYPNTNIDTSKVLRINGSVVFGGLEIKSY